MPDFSKLDFSQFRDIPPLRRSFDIPRLSVSSAGVLTLNSAFLRLLGEEQRSFCIKLSPDGRMLLLIPNGTPSFRFTPKGVLTHREFLELLRTLQIQVPAVYAMEWVESKGCWIGCCQDLPAPPPVAAALSASAKVKRRRSS